MGPDRPGVLAGEIFFWLLLIGGLIWLTVYLARSHGGGSPSGARWQHAVHVCGVNPQFKLAHVTAITQVYPNRGTAGWITWYGTTQPQEAWFEQAFPPLRSWVVVSGSAGYDPQHQNPHIFYVDRVHDVIV